MERRRSSDPERWDTMSGGETTKNLFSVQDRLRSLAKGSAAVEHEYGGFEIRVLDSAAFPWAGVMELLLGIGHDVWVEKRRGAFVVLSKPPAV